MTDTSLPRILIVDDEEAILETMTFTFMDVYEVITTTDARRGIELLDEHAPVAVVITDQRMPEMTGVEFLAKVVERHPDTVRIILTGFADMDATIQAINEGQVYAYINKPWEPDQLKQLVARAVDHHRLTRENRRLVEDLRRANEFLEAVMDRLDTGAIALDPNGIVQAANQPARTYMNLREDPRGASIKALLERTGHERLSQTVPRLADECGGSFEDVELAVDGSAHRVRISAQTLDDANGEPIGRVILFREVSHEPLRRRFDEIIFDVSQVEGDLRAPLERAIQDLHGLVADVQSTGISSSGMAELSERARRSQTAMQNWLDVDDAMAREDYPDAQLLLDRMRVAAQRWPRDGQLPGRVAELAGRVEAYYESGENPKQRVL
ncbi:MAG: response regulator [Myxococcota bacterium]